MVGFGIVERQAIRRGVFKSVKDLSTKIRAFIDGWNHRSPTPFVWTTTAKGILKKTSSFKCAPLGMEPWIRHTLLQRARCFALWAAVAGDRSERLLVEMRK